MFTETYHEPDESTPHTHFFKMHFNTIVPPTYKSPNCLPLQIFQLQTFYALLIPPCVPPVPSTSHIPYLLKKLLTACNSLVFIVTLGGNFQSPQASTTITPDFLRMFERSLTVMPELKPYFLVHGTPKHAVLMVFYA